MRERAAAIGAELAVDPIERGTRVSVRLQAGDRPHRAPTH
jgi:signal transduction histidine kinase